MINHRGAGAFSLAFALVVQKGINHERRYVDSVQKSSDSNRFKISDRIPNALNESACQRLTTSYRPTPGNDWDIHHHPKQGR
jgi:hypothetical protein